MSRIATLTLTTAAMVMWTAGTLASAQSSTQTTPPPTQQTNPPQTQQTNPPQTQTNPPAGSQTAKPSGKGDFMTSGRDEDFIKDVAQASRIEIESSKLAMTKAHNAEVRAFAEKLVKDHTATSEELQNLVKSRGVQWKDDDPRFKEKKQKHESLQRLTGAEFDKEYLEDMISDHEATIAMFAKYSLNASDTALKSFADKTQPALREHLKMARDLKAKVIK
jgi:putative membrane protein